MRRSILLLGSAAILASSAASAADQLKFGKPPAWVTPQAIPTDPGKAADAPVALLLTDQQIRFEAGKTVTYGEVAMKVQTPEGLAGAGNISIPWDPAADTVTVNKFEIHRGTQVIDVLASGQTFTTMRREANLELATLDGVLTANMQPDGLQVGDVIDLATTIEHADPVFGNHVEANFGQWGAARIRFGHFHLEWPASMKLAVRAKGYAAPETMHGASKVIDVSARDIEPVIAPKGAPARFAVARFGEATDFGVWSDVAQLVDPLFRKAAVIPATGPLRDEVEKIRASAIDPKVRAEKALQLVQDRVRYVALLMGQGSYVPTDAATTWSRRFGDCKAKTALLLGILHALDIQAEPLLVQSRLGDVIAERLPMLSYFDHVLVRAQVSGSTYYLDGTRSGDTSLDEIDVPDFEWGLPVVDNTKLVAIVPPPRRTPNQERRIDVDASNGVYAPASITLSETYRGDAAVGFNTGYSALSAAQQAELMRKEASDFFDGFQVGSSSVKFDKIKRELELTIKGTAKLNWKNGWFYIPTSSIAFTPDFERPAGPAHDAPFEVAHPRFVRDVAMIKLPAGLAAQQKLDSPVHETLAGVEYVRTESVSGDVVTVESSERSVAPEISYKEALAATARLKALSADDTYLRVTASYHPTDKDVAALGQSQPGSAGQFVDRGNTFMDAGKFSEAIADFTKAINLDPKSVIALADRAIAYVWMNKLELADKDLDAALSIDPENAIAHRARGLKAETAGDCAAAVQAFTRSLQTEPGNSFALGHRAICENVLGRHAEAVSDAALALKIEPSWGQLHTLRLDSFVRLGQKDAAAREAEQFVNENPQTVPAAWIAVGKVFARAGLQDEAVAAFDKALAIKPEPSTYLARAEIRPSADFDGRMADINAALKLEPMDSGALAAKADLLANQGDLKAALVIYDHALKGLPGQSPLSLSRAVILYKLGRTVEAERLLSAWKRGALTATELNELCWKKATAGILLASAAKDCDQALHINPDYAPAIDSLAFVNLRIGKFEEAVTLYDRALVKSPLSASYMGRALAYRHLGNSSKASADRSEALKRDASIEARFAGYGLKFDEISAATNH